VTVNILSAAHQLAWTQHPAAWLCESCAILWLVLRATRSQWARAGTIFMVAGLLSNAVVTDANAGVMPVVGMPSGLHPVSSMWEAAKPTTRLPFLADQASLGLFSIGDLMLLLGGIVVVGACLRRTFQLFALRALNQTCLVRVRSAFEDGQSPPCKTSSLLFGKKGP
jgi:hypothetical protein